MSRPAAKPVRALVAPMLATVLLVVWTTGVYPFSSYGDDWAVLPAVFILPVVVAWHVGLVVGLREYRAEALIVAFTHITVLLPLWLVCLMLISKDSL